MNIYKNLSADKKFAVKNILIIAVLLIVVHVLVGYLSPNGSTTAEMRGGYTDEMVSLSAYEGADSAKMLVNPIMPPVNSPVPGMDAESYEVSDYFVSIETRDLDNDCSILLSLKERTDVIFESVSESTHGCNVMFKVKHEAVDFVLSYLDELDPTDVNESTYTIKREVSQYEDQITILEKKQATLNTALEDALRNFAEVEAIARRSGDVASLAQVTDSKITTIERINNSRMDVATQLEYLGKAKAETLDRMNFVHFSVNVYENEWVRGDDLKDSWVASIQQLIRDLNGFLQDLSIGFVQFALTVIKYTLYASVLYLIARPVIYRVRQAWNEM
ncbi:MAG: hypothetical protein R3B53_02500 [Candidatus Paceibacterota bacterium]